MTDATNRITQPGPIQQRVIDLITQAGIDPLALPIDGPLDHTGYATVHEPFEIIDNRIVTDWNTWDGINPDLVNQIVDAWNLYHEAAKGPIGRYP